MGWKKFTLYLSTLGSWYPDCPDTEIAGIKLSAIGLGLQTFCLFCLDSESVVLSEYGRYR